MSFADLIARVDRAAHERLGGEVVSYQQQIPTVDPEDPDPPPPPPAVDVTGIFDEVYILAKGAAEAGVETLGPAVFLRLEDLPVDPELDEPTLTIRSVAYKVIERRPDGMGGIVLVLRRS